MARPAPDPQTVSKALALLGEGVSVREAARRLGVSPSTLHAWKAGAETPPRSETKPDEGGKPNVPESVRKRPKPNAGDAATTADHASVLLAEKDERISLLASHVETLTVELGRWQGQCDKLTDALAEEREARRRADVMLQHALARPALPPSDVGSAPPGSRWEKVFFAVVLAVLALLALALLLR
jgi:transposase-like protein